VRTRTGLIATLITLAAVAVAVPLATASPANDNGLVIGIKLTFDSSTHAGGSFAACCAVNDAGSAQADILSFTPTGGDQATFKATNTFTGQNGTFEILLEGVTGPLSSPRHIARAHWTVISGTGAYKTLHGDGRLTAVTDDTNGSLAAIADGEGHSG
jgi:hypothetical protein